MRKNVELEGGGVLKNPIQYNQYAVIDGTGRYVILFMLAHTYKYMVYEWANFS